MMGHDRAAGMVSGERNDMRACGGRWKAAADDPAARAAPASRIGLRRAAFRIVGGLGMLVASAAGGPGAAEEFLPVAPLAARDALGAGIHAFHLGDFQAAYDGLTSAIQAGVEDPRALYFRGLAGLRLGRLDEAAADFSSGAELEASTGSMRRVSFALERVQGHDRLTLERFRARARLAQLTREREARGRRYSGIEDAARDVRRRRRPEDVLPELVAPRPEASEDEPAAAAVEEVPPPKDAAPSGVKPAKPRATEKPPRAAAGDDPFADEPDEKEMAAEVEDSAAEK
jgi:hypothetical protein